MYKKILLVCLFCALLTGGVLVYHAALAHPQELFSELDAEQRQRGNRKRWPESDDQKRRKVKLTSQLNRAQFSPSLIEGLQKYPSGNRAYTIKGNVVAPKDGFSIWKTADGDTAIIDYRVKAGIPLAYPFTIYVLEIPTKDRTSDVYISMCCCPDKGGRDECSLEGEGGLQRCAGADCCAQTFGWIDGVTGQNGTVGSGCY